MGKSNFSKLIQKKTDIIILCIFQVQNVFNLFLEKEAERENEFMMSDQKRTPEDRQRELERLHLENKLECERQQQLFEINLERERQQHLYQMKMLEEKKRSEQHIKKLQAEREDYMKREEKKMQLLMDKWETQQVMAEQEKERMNEEVEKQRQEFRAEMNRIRDEERRREERARQNLIGQGQQNAREIAENLDSMCTSS